MSKMNESSGLDYGPPNHTGYINDPTPGRPDALYSIWDFGGVGDSIRDAVTTISLLDEHLARPTSEIDAKNTRDLIHFNRFSLEPYATAFPRGAQFVLVGTEGACAVEVTYNNPLNTPPKLHPELDGIVSEITGGYYQTISNRLIQYARSDED